MVIIIASSGGDQASKRAVGVVGAPGICEVFRVMVWGIGWYVADHGRDRVRLVDVSWSRERRKSFARAVGSLAY